MTPSERALIAEYEAVLSREGLSVLDERELLHPAHVGGGTQTRSKEAWDVAAKAEFWGLVTKGVSELPRNYPHRGFLVRLAESGNLLATCREYRLTHNKGRWEFGVFLRSVGLGSSRPARYVTR
jgi:hypothetical protein